jgi:hypothetical protein
VSIILTACFAYVEWHHVDGTHLTAQYFLVVDALNFCFWPGAACTSPGARRTARTAVQQLTAQGYLGADEDLEYENLARGVKVSLSEWHAREGLSLSPQRQGRGLGGCATVTVSLRSLCSVRTIAQS